MKLYKDILVQGIQLVQQATGEPDLASLTVHASRNSARSLLVGKHRRAVDGEENEGGDDFLASLEGGLGGSGDDADFDFLSAFGGEGDFLSFEGSGDNNESGWFDLSTLMGGDEEDTGNNLASFFSGLMLGGIGGAGEEEGDGFAMLGDVMQNVEECGIDLADMATKALEAFMTMGTEMGTVDYSDPQSFDVFAQILMAFKDDDEVECSETEADRLPTALQNFLQCSGLSDFFPEDDAESTALIQTILDSCNPILDTLIAGDGSLSSLVDEHDEGNDFDSLGEDCVRAFYGDNPMGNTIRFEYQHIDEVFGCLGNLGDDMPHCVISSPSTPDDERRMHSVPLSLLKKLACVLGSSYKPALDMVCVSIYEGLDECLPQLDEDETNGATSLCGREHGIVLGKTDFGMDSSVLTGNKIPSFCTEIFDMKGIDISELKSRLDRYNRNREYGWTLENAGNVEANTEVEEAKEARISLNSPTKERPSQESSESLLASPASSSAVHISMRNLLLVVFGAIALALAIKYSKGRRRPATSRGSGRSALSNATVSRQNYAHVAMEMEGNEIL
ncbi:hypothetical protein HJC23_000825 [Cyclotella cryptica]|uniref:Uncharacterized protein n=1 Tax=Cyclotella cryptica TaxID=29204 RepID=A0ABD3Q604_9STRA|eukprot:CCRYP_008464-RG/>CCRYP_008464-RG protein AED:0.05 eAED:0.05 QI:0/0.75/0.8/1/0.75/0.6/5/1692/561